MVGQLFECTVREEGRALFNHASYLEKGSQRLLMKHNDPSSFYYQMCQKQEVGLIQSDTTYFDYRRYFDLGMNILMDMQIQTTY